MLAFRVHELGSVADFRLEEVPAPRPGKGQLLVRVEATAIGYVDRLVMQGRYQVKPSTPFVPGGEIVGVIEAIGEEVSGFQPGQRVASWQFGGGLAEYVLLCAGRTVPVPAVLAPASAASFLLDYLTAHYGLFDRGGLTSGQTVLVTGASGGVGSAAVQLASASGATVIGLASGELKRATVASLGASLVIDYRNVEWRATLKRVHPSGVDRVFDPVGGALLEPCFRSLAKGGRHLVVGFAAGGDIASLPSNLTLLKSGELVGVDARYLWDSEPERVRSILGEVLDMVADDRLSPLVWREFALEEAASAVAALDLPDRIGKVIVRP